MSSPTDPTAEPVAGADALTETERQTMVDAAPFPMTNREWALIFRAAGRIKTAAVASQRAELDEAVAEAQAEAGYALADYDRRGERLWRLAALAGWRPGNESDNDHTAELYVTDALAELDALRAQVAALTHAASAVVADFDGSHRFWQAEADLRDDTYSLIHRDLYRLHARDANTPMSRLRALLDAPAAAQPDQTCTCRVVGTSRDPYEPHIPAEVEWEQADDCPVHPQRRIPEPTSVERWADEWDVRPLIEARLRRAAVDALRDAATATLSMTYPTSADPDVWGAWLTERAEAIEAAAQPERECRPCADTHPNDGCADVGCTHNCEAEVVAAQPERDGGAS